MVDYMDNFLTGINFIYNPISTQELCFQVLDSRNYSFSRTYGYLPSNIKDAKVPFVYTLNWNGSFCEDLIKTRWSASIMQEGKKKNMYYYALGNEFNKGPINAFFDFMYARQALDRKGIMTSIINEDLADGRIDYTALTAKYMSYVLKINCRVTPYWNIFAKGMYETAGLYVENSLREKGKYRTSWGYIGGVEYYPMKSNLHFFLTYVGRSYRFTNRAKALGWGDHSTDQITMGFIYKLPVF